jgi:hypothetical protein
MNRDYNLPTTIAEVTREWVTDALLASGALAPDSRVSALAARDLGEGRGMTGSVWRVSLEYEGPATSAPRTLIVKLSATDDTYRDYLANYESYSREVRLYNEIAPTMLVTTPQSHRSLVSDDGRVCVMLLEDFSDHRAGDQLAGCSETDARHCVIALARLHASNWEMSPFPAWLDPRSGAMGEGRVAVIPRAWARMVEKYATILPRAVRDAAAQYSRVFPLLQDWARRPPVTIRHGDFRLDNILFGAEPTPEALVFIDWQGTTVGRGMADVAYFLTQSMPAANRRLWERELLGLYGRELADHGIQDADATWGQYRLGALYNLALAAGIAVYDPADERGATFVRTAVGRAGDAIEDLDLMSLLAAIDRDGGVAPCDA